MSHTQEGPASMGHEPIVNCLDCGGSGRKLQGWSAAERLRHQVCPTCGGRGTVSDEGSVSARTRYVPPEDLDASDESDESVSGA